MAVHLQVPRPNRVRREPPVDPIRDSQRPGASGILAEMPRRAEPEQCLSARRCECLARIAGGFVARRHQRWGQNRNIARRRHELDLRDRGNAGALKSIIDLDELDKIDLAFEAQRVGRHGSSARTSGMTVDVVIGNAAAVRISGTLDQLPGKRHRGRGVHHAEAVLVVDAVAVTGGAAVRRRRSVLQRPGRPAAESAAVVLAELIRRGSA